MKSYLKIFTLILLAILLGTSLTFIFAQSRGGNNGNGHRPDVRGEGGGFDRCDFGFGGFNQRLLDQLNLTAEQGTQINALQTTAQTASESLRDELETIREQIRTAIENGALNEAQVTALLRSRAEIQVQLELIRLRANAAIYNLLTAEQRTLLETLRQQHQPGHGSNINGSAANSNRH